MESVLLIGRLKPALLIELMRRSRLTGLVLVEPLVELLMAQQQLELERQLRLPLRQSRPGVI
jgi:hypothetical protein